MNLKPTIEFLEKLAQNNEALTQLCEAMDENKNNVEAHAKALQYIALTHPYKPAHKFTQSFEAQTSVRDAIYELFEKYEPELHDLPEFEMSFGGDEYDTSIEIYFDMSLPYPYEPCLPIRKAVFEMGFDNVYWNFKHDFIDANDTRNCDEVRNYEPRHTKNGNLWKCTEYGFADARFDEKAYVEKYFQK